jgi:hypothetical protein
MVKGRLRGLALTFREAWNIAESRQKRREAEKATKAVRERIKQIYLKAAMWTAHSWTIYILFPLWYLLFAYVYFQQVRLPPRDKGGQAYT